MKLYLTQNLILAQRVYNMFKKEYLLKDVYVDLTKHHDLNHGFTFDYIFNPPPQNQQVDLIYQVALSTTKIIDAVNLSTNNGTLSAVFVAVVGALSAFGFNLLQQINERRINRIKNISSSILDLINTLENVALKYWTIGFSQEKKDDLSIDEVKIKSLNPLIDKHIEILLSHLSRRVKNKYKAESLSDFSSKIFTLTTGGDFESPNRISSKSTAVAISKKCLEATTIIKSISP